MEVDLGDPSALAVVAQVEGSRGDTRLMDASVSRLSEVIRRLETQSGVRLLNHTTRNVSLAGAR